MAPKQQRVVVERADRRRPNNAPKGYIGQAYGALTAPENASVVRSIAIFGVRFFPLQATHDQNLTEDYRLLLRSSRVPGASSYCRRESPFSFEVASRART
jgi:hypothetical protein